MVQRESMGMSEDQILVKDAGANKLQIQNLTEEIIPSVRVFYKYYMEDKKIFLWNSIFCKIVRVRSWGRTGDSAGTLSK